MRAERKDFVYRFRREKEKKNPSKNRGGHATLAPCGVTLQTSKWEPTVLDREVNFLSDEWNSSPVREHTSSTIVCVLQLCFAERLRYTLCENIHKNTLATSKERLKTAGTHGGYMKMKAEQRRLPCQIPSPNYIT